MSITIERIDYKNYGQALKISNGTAEAVVTLEVGPRVVFWGFCGGRNLMMNDLDRAAVNAGPAMDAHYHPGATWYIYGGHRLWTSPEHQPGSYYPDNDPVTCTVTDNGAIFTPPPQQENGVAMQLELLLDETAPKLEVRHRVTNISREAKTFSLWALTVMAQDTLEIIPQNTLDTDLLHNRVFSVWPYTDMSDPRVFFGNRFVSLKQDPTADKPFKIGMNLEHPAVVCLLGDTAFIKRYDANYPDGCYPDAGVSFETYTNPLFIEVETLSELRTVPAGDTASHTEQWALVRCPDAEVDPRDEQSLRRFYEKVI